MSSLRRTSANRAGHLRRAFSPIAVVADGSCIAPAAIIVLALDAWEAAHPGGIVRAQARDRSGTRILDSGSPRHRRQPRRDMGAPPRLLSIHGDMFRQTADLFFARGDFARPCGEKALVSPDLRGAAPNIAPPSGQIAFSEGDIRASHRENPVSGGYILLDAAHNALARRT